MAVNPGRKIRGKGEKNKMDMVTDVSNRIFRAPGETGRQQPQRWFNTADITVAHQSNLLKQLDQQRRREQFCDCSVLVEGQLFRAHRNVLFASSGYFRMLLSQSAEGPCDVASATFDAFSPDTFTVILDFIYSGQLELTSLNVIEVMSAASYLQMNSVIKYCKNFITSSLDISIKEEESDRAIVLPEVCSFPRGDGQEALSEQEQEQAPCSLSPPPALWTTQDSVCTQTGFMVKSPEREGLTLKTSPSSPAVEANTELEELQDPSDPLFTLPGPERRRGRAAAAVKRRMPYCTRSSTQQDLLEVQEARAQKAERAEELYASLPAFVGLIGHFSKDANPTMRFKCPFCTHTVKRKADLKRHLRCHTGERPYPCQACNKRFTRLEHLRSHFETIHQARKLVCRKCKCSVTEETGHVVCEGTRRYRMCSQCIQEVGCENVPLDTTDGTSQEPALLLGVDGEEQEGERSWVVNGDDQEDDDDLAEDSGTDLIIQEVDDSDEEMQ